MLFRQSMHISTLSTR